MEHAISGFSRDAEWTEAPPEWIMLVPAGEFTDAACQTWNNSRPDLILQNHSSRHSQIVGDWEHSSVVRAPKGDRADAAGWVTEMENRDGAIWGKISWTAAGASAIEGKAQRYISPYIAHAPDRSMIYAVLSFALTNQPNFPIPALTSASAEGRHILSTHNITLPEEEKMEKKVPDAVRNLFGIPLDMSDEDAEKKLSEIKGQAAQSTASAQRAATAEANLQTEREKVATQTKAAHDQAVETALDHYQSDEQKKMLPSEREIWKKYCSTAEALDEFKAAMDKRPKLLDEQLVDTSAHSGTSETSTESEVDEFHARYHGMTVPEWQAHKAKDKALGNDAR